MISAKDVSIFELNVGNDEGNDENDDERDKMACAGLDGVQKSIGDSRLLEEITYSAFLSLSRCRPLFGCRVAPAESPPSNHSDIRHVWRHQHLPSSFQRTPDNHAKDRYSNCSNSGFSSAQSFLA